MQILPQISVNFAKHRSGVHFTCSDSFILYLLIAHERVRSSLWSKDSNYHSQLPLNTHGFKCKVLNQAGFSGATILQTISRKKRKEKTAT